MEIDPHLHRGLPLRKSARAVGSLGRTTSHFKTEFRRHLEPGNDLKLENYYPPFLKGGRGD